MPEVRHLPRESLRLLYSIDRSEEIDTAYAFDGGELRARPVAWSVPPWDPVGRGDHSVAGFVDDLDPLLEQGGVLLGAFDGEVVQGLAIVVPGFEPGMTWLAFLHVSWPHRRRGVASVLWDEVERLAIEHGDRRIYVSSTPSGSAVGFYLSQGCEPARPPHPDLFYLEPEDIHLIRELERR